MRNLILIVFILLFDNSIFFAQGIADDFTMIDCYGDTQNLYSELDSNKVVIMEFVMTCGPCIYAGTFLEAMIADLEEEYPGKILFYQFGYSSSYTCDTMIYFKDSNNFHSIPFADGSHIFPLYGGFGMPTIAVVAGTNHDILFSNVGFLNTDTTLIGIAARNFFTHLSISCSPQSTAEIVFYPNPATNIITTELNLSKNSDVHVEVVDMHGKLVKDIFSQNFPTGFSQISHDISSIPVGNYLLKADRNGNIDYQIFSVVR